MKRLSRLALPGLLVACATQAAGAQAVNWSDGFESYANNQILPAVSNWEEWDNNLAGSNTKTKTAANGIAVRTGTQAIWIRGSSDTIYRFDGNGPGGEGPYTSGQWSLGGWVYKPVNTTNFTMDIPSFFIVLNQYQHNAAAGYNNWSVEVTFNPMTGMWFTDVDGGGTTGPAVFDQWVEMRADIDLDSDMVQLYYNGAVMGPAYAWNGGASGFGTGVDAIGCLDLFADGGLNVGSRVYWDDMFLTGGAVCSSAPQTYCTAGTSASGCQASISASGTASASASSGFNVTVSNLEGDKDGIIIYGQAGKQALPWGNGTSLRCVVAPLKRGGLQSGGGTAGLCNGTIVQDLNARWCPTCPKPGHNPSVGKMQISCWYRDPFNTSNQTTSFSNAVEVDVCP